MRKFKFKDKEFEMNYTNDIAPVLLGNTKDDKDINKQLFEKKYPDTKIYSYTTSFFNEENKVLEPITYFYAGAEAVNKKTYKPIEDYDSEMPPTTMIIETTLQVNSYKKKIYTTIEENSCLSMLELLDFAIEDILNRYKNKNHMKIDLYDDGGWSFYYESYADYSNIKELVTSIRLVEEIF